MFLLWKLLKEAANDPNTSIVAVTGAGNYFCSGNDLSNFTTITGSLTEAAEGGRQVLEYWPCQNCQAFLE